MRVGLLFLLVGCGAPNTNVDATVLSPEVSVQTDATSVDVSMMGAEVGVVPGTPPSDLAGCEANAASGMQTNVNFCTVSYVGGAGDDTTAGVDLQQDGTVVWAGTAPMREFGMTAVELEGGGAGVVLRYSPSGGTLRSVTRIGASLSDVQVRSGDNSIAVAGTMLGAAVLSNDGTRLLWRRELAGAARISIGNDGSVAALANKTIVLWDASGTELRRWQLTDSTVNDVAVHGPSRLVIATGFNQVSGNLQWPFVRAYRFDGTVAWDAWRYTQADGLTSDTRGTVVSIGRDGMLYYGGESHGGVTAHFRDPLDFSQRTPLVQFDLYNQSSNWNGAAPLAFFARMNPSTGALLAAQLIAPRLSNGKGNGSSITAITADETGQVVVVGNSACCIQNMPPRTINQQPSLAGYAGGGFFLVASPDLRTRLHWNAFTPGSMRGVASANGQLAFALQQNVNREGAFDALVTVRAAQSAPAGGRSEGVLAVGKSFR